MPQPTFWRICRAAIALFAFSCNLSAHAEPAPSPANSLADARLRAIAFIDPDHGWAVGDRGIIWRTTDGGRKWDQQSAGVSCRLDCVYFADATHGWIVGGWSQSYSTETSGVVLRTTDGGESWTRVPGTLLPALSRVRFFNPREGLAWGDSTAMYPAGVFRTIDGGRSWQTLPPGPWNSVAAADFVDGQRGVIAAADGQVHSLVYGRATSNRNPSVGQRRIHDVRIAGDKAWLVGDAGLVMFSDNGGGTWRTIDTIVPGGAANEFDFQSLAVWGTHCWIAGSPGSVVFHTPDDGRTWERLVTGQSLPIDGITFFDDGRGWCVGALGTILATRDGGRTWWSQRSGGTRAALMTVFSEPHDAPWEMFAWYCGNDGYLGVAHFLNRRESTVSSPVALTDRRVEEAVVAVGGTATKFAWNFPLHQEGLAPTMSRILESWNRVNDGDGNQQLKEQLAREIRIWRPDVIVTADTSKNLADPVAAHIGRMLLAAVELAADPAFLADQMSFAGLSEWRVSKVFTTHTQGNSNARLSSAQLAANLGAAVDDYAMRGRALISEQYVESPKQWNFLLVANTLPEDAAQHDLFAGLRLPPASEARRELGQPSSLVLEKLSRVAQQRRNMERLISQSSLESGAGTAWVGQLSDMTEGLPMDAASTVLFHLAMRYDQRGQSEMAAETLRRVVDTCPEHDLADAALAWLVRYYSSGEQNWRLRQQTQIHTHLLQSSVPDFAAQPEMRLPLSEQTIQGTAGPQFQPFERGAQTLELAELVARTRPTLFARPEFRFPVASAHKWRGQTREADSFYTQLASSALDPAWRDCALAEQWLQHGRGKAPKPVVNCPRAAARPRLDGNLNDELWQQSPPLALHIPGKQDSDWPATLMLAYDDEFLYFAAVCQRAPQEKYVNDPQPRRRDAELAQRDRIELLLDIDRDYTSFYRLTIDHRGWGSDDCCGDRTWNPKWYIAQQEDSQSWRVEAAIAWDQLTPAAPRPRAAWAIGLQRVAPQSGFQSWSTPAGVEPVPQGMGLLIFQ